MPSREGQVPRRIAFQEVNLLLPAADLMRRVVNISLQFDVLFPGPFQKNPGLEAMPDFHDIWDFHPIEGSPVAGRLFLGRDFPY